MSIVSWKDQRPPLAPSRSAHRTSRLSPGPHHTANTMQHNPTEKQRRGGSSSSQRPSAFICWIFVGVGLMGALLLWRSSSTLGTTVDGISKVNTPSSSLDFFSSPVGVFVAKAMVSAAILVVSIFGTVLPLWWAGRNRRGKNGQLSPHSPAPPSLFLSLGNCFSAGLLLGMGALHFLPEAIEAQQRRLALLTVDSSTADQGDHGHDSHAHSTEDKLVFVALLVGLCIPLLIDTVQQVLSQAGVISSEHAHSHGHPALHDHDHSHSNVSHDDDHTSDGGSSQIPILPSAERSGGNAAPSAPYGTFSGVVTPSNNSTPVLGAAVDERSVCSSNCSSGSVNIANSIAATNNVHTQNHNGDQMGIGVGHLCHQSPTSFSVSPPKGQPHKQKISTAPSPQPPSASATSMSSVIILACLLTFHGLTEGFMLGLESSGSAIISIMIPLCIHKFFDAFVLGLRMVGRVDLFGNEGPSSSSISVCQRLLNLIKKSFWALLASLSTPVSLMIIALVVQKDVVMSSNNLPSSSSLSSSSSSPFRAGSAPPPSIAYIVSQAVGAGSFLYIALADILPMEFHQHQHQSALTSWHRSKQFLGVVLGILFVHALSIVFPHAH